MDAVTRERIAARSEVIRRLKRMLIERLSLPYRDADLHEDVSLLGSGLGLDSLDALELLLGIEQEFGAKVDAGSIGVLRSINSVADYLLERGIGFSSAFKVRS
jgi:acyl carrier protein